MHRVHLHRHKGKEKNPGLVGEGRDCARTEGLPLARRVHRAYHVVLDAVILGARLVHAVVVRAGDAQHAGLLERPPQDAARKLAVAVVLGRRLAMDEPGRGRRQRALPAQGEVRLGPMTRWARPAGGRRTDR